MRSLVILAPAKINLILKVLGHRPDGYHELSTLFHRISLCDRITFRKIDRPKFHLVVKGAKLGRTQDNLVYHAYQLLNKLIHWEGGVEVVLEKKIPHAAGLGGGSSDAAHFLIGMNQLLKLGLSLKTLLKLGARLGSDVPFFLHEANQAVGTGRGEKIRMLPSKNKRWFVLLMPSFKISTSLVYKVFDSMPLTRISHDATITSALSNRKEKDWPYAFLENDLYPASCVVRPQLKRFDMLYKELGIKQWLMSGSGPAMFSIHRSKREAQSVAQLIRRRAPKGNIFVCHTY